MKGKTGNKRKAKNKSDSSESDSPGDYSDKSSSENEDEDNDLCDESRNIAEVLNNRRKMKTKTQVPPVPTTLLPSQTPSLADTVELMLLRNCS